MALLDRRSFLVAGGTVGLSPWASCDVLAQADALAQLHAKARAEGELTWYIAHYRTDTAEALGQLFMQTWPGVKCNVVRATGQIIYQRLMQDAKAKAHHCDVFSTTDISQNLALRKLGMLQPYKPVGFAQLVPVVQAASDPDGYFTATDCNMTILFHDSRAVKAEQAPRRFRDLADPRWAGQVALAHPGFSGAMGAWVVAMEQRYGWDYFVKLAKNKPHVSRSLADPPVTISSGESKVGIGPATMAPGLLDKGVPIVASIPEEGAQLGFGPTALVAQSERPNAARLFLEFLISKPAVTLLASVGAMPIRADVAAKSNSWHAGQVKGFRTPAAEIEAKLPGLIEKWRDTFGV